MLEIKRRDIVLCAEAAFIISCERKDYTGSRDLSKEFVISKLLDLPEASFKQNLISSWIIYIQSCIGEAAVIRACTIENYYS